MKRMGLREALAWWTVILFFIGYIAMTVTVVRQTVELNRCHEAMKK